MGQSRRNIGDRKSTEVTNHQMTLIETMAKYVILVSISLLSTLIVAGVLGIRALVFSDNSSEANLWMYYIHYTGIIINTLANVICLLLQFAFFGNEWFKKWCHCLHNQCKTCARVIALRKINQLKPPRELVTHMKGNVQSKSSPTTSAQPSPEQNESLNESSKNESQKAN